MVAMLRKEKKVVRISARFLFFRKFNRLALWYVAHLILDSYVTGTYI